MTDKKRNQAKDWREARRLQAWKLKQKGWKQNKIAEALGVSEGAVSQWVKRGQQGGVEALQSRTGGGPKPRLSEAQLKALPKLLARGAEAYGFRGDVWTRGRVGKLIKTEFEVTYSARHVGRILEKIEWSRQKPIERASQRNEAVIEQWRSEKWPDLKKKPKEKRAP